MKRILKIGAGLLLFLVIAAAGVVSYLAFRKPAMAEPSPIRVERTEQRVARGKYLFEHLCSCSDCHSKVDMTRFAFPIVPGGLAKGKEFPTEGMDLPGRVVAPNLTSDPETGLGNWTDGEILRAFREGIGRDGRALFPFMPYTEYANLSDEDAHSIVAYVRTLPPVSNRLPRSEISFPVNLLIKSAPRPVGSVPSPNRSDPVAYGKYLTKVAGCQFCHTPVGGDNTPIAGKEFSGGQEFPLGPGAAVRSFNLTPDPETGTGKWTEAEFVEKFYQYKEYAAKGAPEVPLSDNTVMPWLGLSGLEREDLAAIFAYLRTVPPIVNAVETKPTAVSTKKE